MIPLACAAGAFLLCHPPPPPTPRPPGARPPGGCNHPAARAQPTSRHVTSSSDPKPVGWGQPFQSTEVHPALLHARHCLLRVPQALLPARDGGAHTPCVSGLVMAPNPTSLRASPNCPRTGSTRSTTRVVRLRGDWPATLGPNKRILPSKAGLHDNKCTLSPLFPVRPRINRVRRWMLHRKRQVVCSVCPCKIVVGLSTDALA